jgi:hypothetical protein
MCNVENICWLPSLAAYILQTPRRHIPLLIENDTNLGRPSGNLNQVFDFMIVNGA